MAPKSKEKIEGAAEEETVVVKRADLEALMSKVEKLGKDRDILFSVADKSQLAKLRNTDEENLIKTCKIMKWKDGQYVIGWKMTKNTSEILPGSNRWVEDQATNIILEDGTIEEISLVEFYRSRIQKVLAEIVSTETKVVENQKRVYFTVQFEDGKQLLIDSVFVN